MPRTARVIAENGICHVVNRGNGRAVVFGGVEGSLVTYVTY